MAHVFGGRRFLVIGLASFGFLILFGLFQNFSEVGFQKYEYTPIDIGNLGGPLQQAIPASVNKKGHVAGQSQNKQGEWHAFMWTPREGMRDLGTLGGSESRALHISDDDEVFGLSLDPSGELRRFSWSSGKMKDMGRVDGTVHSFNHNMAVGQVRRADEKSESAALWHKDKKVELKTLGGHYALARGFNSQGVIVGEAENRAGVLRPVVWSVMAASNSDPVDIFKSMNSPAQMGRGFGVNDQGEVVGQAITSEGSFAFIWSSQNGIRDINRLMKDSDPEFPNRRWVLQQAMAIGGCGQVAGLGLASDTGSGRAFLLTPVEVRSGCN